VFWQSFNIPISEWDEFATHAFNAKVFYYERSLEYLPNQPHSTYPLHVPLIQTWLNLNWGSWDHQYLKTIFPFYFLCLLVIQYYFLKKYTTQQWSLFGIVLLTSAPFLIYHATTAYRDFTLLFYHTAAILLLLMWNKEKFSIYLLSASLFAGFASFTKLEGTGYLLIHTTLLIVIITRYNDFTLSDKLKIFMKFCIPAFSICLFFHIYRYCLTLTETPLSVKSSLGFDLYKIEFNISNELLNKFGTILYRFYENLFFSNNWNIVWLIFFLSLFKLKRKSYSTEIKLLLLAMFLFFGIYIAGYSLTQHYYWIAQTRTVLSRCILHIFPLAPILITLINFSDKVPPK
jgi:hypothetical protein